MNTLLLISACRMASIKSDWLCVYQRMPAVVCTFSLIKLVSVDLPWLGPFSEGLFLHKLSP
jgi:hypothetical protein